MLRAKRQDLILQVLQEKGIATTEELMEKTGASKATVHRDISEMASEGSLEKIRGGARLLSAEANIEPTLTERAAQNTEEKKRIAQAAAAYIRDGERIILDSGTTTYELARLLNRFSGLTVITNDLRIALEVATRTRNKLFFIGGTIRDGFCYSYGYHAEAMLRGISANKIFLSVDAIDPEHGIMNYIMEDINLKTIGMDNAAEAFLLCDHSKFETQALFSVGMLDKITRAITGWELPGETREAFVEAGVDLICV